MSNQSKKAQIKESNVKSVVTKPVVSSHTPDSSATECLHKSYKGVLTSKGADGIEDVITRDLICNTCGKRLAKQYRCISASWADLYDKEWAEREGIKEDEY
jgi:hypothetical protein